MSKKQTLAGLDNIGIEKNPLDEFLEINEDSAISSKKGNENSDKKDREPKMGRPRTRENYKHCSLDIPMEIYETLRTMSFQRDIPMNSIIISALLNFF